MSQSENQSFSYFFIIAEPNANTCKVPDQFFLLDQKLTENNHYYRVLQLKKVGLFIASQSTHTFSTPKRSEGTEIKCVSFLYAYDIWSSLLVCSFTYMQGYNYHSTIR
jgi:hypothetical protein